MKVRVFTHPRWSFWSSLSLSQHRCSTSAWRLQWARSKIFNFLGPDALWMDGWMDGWMDIEQNIALSYCLKRLSAVKIIGFNLKLPLYQTGVMSCLKCFLYCAVDNKKWLWKLTQFTIYCHGIVLRAEVWIVKQCPAHNAKTATTPSESNTVQGMWDLAWWWW